MTNTTTINNSKLYDKEYALMLEYALKAGIQLPSSTVISSSEETRSLESYNNLIKAIAPVTPKSIAFINASIIDSNNESKWFHLLLFRKCLLLSMLALVTLIAVSLSGVVNHENQAAGLLSASGPTLLLNLVFVCSAALLGVMFFILKSLSIKVRSYTLIPEDIVELNVTIVIGVVSGFVVSELFSFENTTIADNIEMQKMTLALLGGFSSDAIFSILQGITSKVKSFFSTS